jgi:hypothetical protein
MLADVYVHMDDLGHAMTTMRIFIPSTNIVWLYTYCRYVRTLAHAAAATQVFVYQTQYHSFSNDKKNPNKCITEDMTPTKSYFYPTR